jgi:hypothetical protein
VKGLPNLLAQMHSPHQLVKEESLFPQPLSSKVKGLLKSPSNLVTGSIPRRADRQRLRRHPQSTWEEPQGSMGKLCAVSSPQGTRGQVAGAGRGTGVAERERKGERPQLQPKSADKQLSLSTWE